MNHDNRGDYLGSFNTGDSILLIKKDGTYYITDFELTNRYKTDEILSINKFNSEDIISILHFDGKSKSYYIKRFQIETTTLNTSFLFISKERASKLVAITLYGTPSLLFNYRLNNGDKKEKEIIVDDFVGIKGWKALGNKILKYKNMSAFRFTDNKVKEETDGNQETLTLF